MNKFMNLVDTKIKEAMERGDFDNLPGTGRTLDLTEDPFTPEDQRMAYRILKNSGFIPPEVEMLNQISLLRERIVLLGDLDQLQRRELTKELRSLEVNVRTRMEAMQRNR